MNLELYNIRNLKVKSAIVIICGVVRKLFILEDTLSNNSKMDEESNTYVVKKQLRCAISGCFDKNNICCKECDIKKCRYKCNFIDKDICEHQFI